MKRMMAVGVVAVSALLATTAFAQDKNIGDEGALNPASETTSTDEVTSTNEDPKAQDDGEGDGEGDANIDAESEPVAEEGGSPLPFRTSVGVSGSFGAATVLSASEFTQTDYFSSGVNLGISYSPIDEIGLSAGIGYSKYLTEAGGSVFQREGRLSDTSLGANYTGWQDEEYTGISISGGLGFSLPTSIFSQFARRLLGSSARVTLSRSFGGLGLSYTFSVRKNFHEFTSIVGDPDEIDLLARGGGEEEISNDLVALQSGVLTEWGISNSFSAGFGFFDYFSAGLSLGYSDSWSYDNGTITEPDGFTAENAVSGRGHRQSVSGGLSLGARVNDYFSVGASMGTGGAPLSSDNKGLRFPFFDFENGQAARTSFSLSASASY